jgi:hypothetical protein
MPPFGLLISCTNVAMSSANPIVAYMTTSIAVNRRWRLIRAVNKTGSPIKKPIQTQDAGFGVGVSPDAMNCHIAETTASARRSP